MKTYKARKGKLITGLVILTAFLPFIVGFYNADNLFRMLLGFFILALPFAIVLWIYIDTSYRIVDGVFYYRSAFLKGKIDIQTITKASKDVTYFTGVKPALATKGIVIYFNRFDEIYIAPENNDELIAELLKINPEIEVVNK